MRRVLPILYLFVCCHLISAQEKATPAAKPQNAKAANKAVVAKLEEEMESRQKDIDRIVEDQGRLRENMKALRGSAEEKALLQRYTRQLDEQETQLDALRKKIQDTEAQRDKANNALEKMIDELQIEATMCTENLSDRFHGAVSLEARGGRGCFSIYHENSLRMNFQAAASSA